MQKRVRRWRSTILAVGACALVAFLVLKLNPPSRITQQNYERIELGMGRAEVEAILGPPSD